MAGWTRSHSTHNAYSAHNTHNTQVPPSKHLASIWHSPAPFCRSKGTCDDASWHRRGARYTPSRQFLTLRPPPRLPTTLSTIRVKGRDKKSQLNHNIAQQNAAARRGEKQGHTHHKRDEVHARAHTNSDCPVSAALSFVMTGHTI